MKKTREITEIAAAIALTVICGFLRLYRMPQGGSISLTMLPLLVLSFRRGAKKAIIAGSIYGLINLATDGVVYHPLSILLDYVLAFGSIGVAGFFKKTACGIVTGSIIGAFCRYLCSLLSGAILFAEYAPKGQNPWIYSSIYNAVYMVPELIICIIVMIILAKKTPWLFNPDM